MRKTLLIILILFLFSCRQEIIYEPEVHNDEVSVLTQHNDHYRSGLNPHEKILNTSNVNSKQFGKLFSIPVDDQIYAQPLIVSNLRISDSLNNVVYIATVNNTVYACDASNGTVFWKRNYTQPGMRPVKNSDMTGACSGNYQDYSGNMGIAGTPVIDANSKTMYFVARSVSNQNFVEYFHAIDIMTGADKPGSPVKIAATYPGGGDGSVNNVLSFDAQKENQRQGLTLLNGIVYVTFAGHCDWAPYHGWILGYDAKSLQQKIVFNTTPEGSDGGIWESGMGLATDNEGNIYAAVGNGTVGVKGDPTNLINRGESALKLVPSGNTLQVISYFTPNNFQYLEDYDYDYGSMGAMLIPNSDYFLTGGKDGNLYLLDKDNMGDYSPTANHNWQMISLGANAMLHAQPAYYKGKNGEYIYVWTENDQLRAFPFDRNTNRLDVANQKVSSISGPTGESGADISTSSNADSSGSGIVWASYPFTGNANQLTQPGILRAFDAEDVTKELWNNHLNPDDDAGNFAKFCSPTIANGKVYLATFSNQLVVYGLK
ncbi:MAG: hypothetical protein ACTHK8_01975 [Ginsengibacter sp.]